MRTLIVALAAITLGFPVMSHANSHPRSAAQEMAETAANFLAALSPEQREAATFEFDADERHNWHFVPRPRNGIPIKELTTTQRHLLQALLSSGLSHQGLIKAYTIMSLEQILHELEGGAAHRDPELYYITIFGRPGPEATWGWRLEGHHLAINFTIVDGEHVAGTPSFFGANPAEVRNGPRAGLRALAAEEDLGRELIQALSDEQREVAIFSTRAPRDIITGAERKVEPLPLAGIPAADLDDSQQQLLLRLIEEFVRRHRPELADQDLEKIHQAGFGEIHFGWAGATEPGQGHYYRIQGPTFILEYDNVQNNANHIHAVWRDFENDFGEDLLRRHYELHPHD